ncbi:MAG: indolepyruvate ferredoxin oxidoreductase subunit alpha [Clostridia bacterium]|nr:indolepyruvate ferredoxin oxidoreductase subunit alpha [Clostridia bacterium]
MAQKVLMTGNEAIARGAWEAGVRFAAAYPGTPSTEILENLSTYKDIDAQWSPNEKVALEAAFGASVAGGRAFASMKHVGINVAADPLFTIAYSGSNAGLVIVTADEPGQHSSQNEQDNRNFARHAKMPMLEPADSQECKDMVKLAFDMSEEYDCPVLIRVTTRVCHSKSLVELCERVEKPIVPYVKNAKKYVDVPANARIRRVEVEKHMDALKVFSNETALNVVEDNGKKIGVITSGMCYHYAREVFENEANYLRIGFSFPLPMGKIAEFCKGLDKVYIIEENDEFIEDAVKMLGFGNIAYGKYAPDGSRFFHYCGELTSDVIRATVTGQAFKPVDFDRTKIVARPPALCAGCPHRGLFYELGKRKNVVVSGDIGCYTLAFAPPYNAMDFNCCMGASISSGNGAQKIFNKVEGNDKRVVSVLGDSTFFHSGITSLLDVVYNRGNNITVILDNRITGMTGHQQNPGTGYTAQGAETVVVDIEAIVKACGVKNIKVIDPNDLKAVKDAIDWALACEEASVIITKYPCVLKKFSNIDKAQYPNAFKSKCAVNTDKCIGCKACLKCGCPAISVVNKKAAIDPTMCVGCTVCKQICPVKAID